MAKIRGIKPDFWTDEDIVELTIPARLLFIGLWHLACDNGHLDDKPKQIRMRIYPGDHVDVDGLLEELVDHKRIIRDGKTITIPKFSHHQKPHKRWWVTCDLPHCVHPDATQSHVDNTPQPLTNGGPTVATSRPTADGDGEGEGELKVKVSSARKLPARRLPNDWTPTEEHQKRATGAGINLEQQADKFRLHAAEKDRTASNWNAAFTRWLMNAAEWATQERGGKPAPPPRPHVSTLEYAPSGMTDEECDAWEAEQRRKQQT